MALKQLMRCPAGHEFVIITRRNDDLQREFLTDDNSWTTKRPACGLCNVEGRSEVLLNGN